MRRGFAALASLLILLMALSGCIGDESVATETPPLKKDERVRDGSTCIDR